MVRVSSLASADDLPGGRHVRLGRPRLNRGCVARALVTNCLMGQHKDAASFTAVTQNLRGLTTKKLEIIIKNMEDKAVDITVLQETWKVTPTGVAIEELGKYITD